MDLDDKNFSRRVGRRCACFNLRRAARLVTQKFDHAFKETGLKSTQFSVLIALVGWDGILISRLARILGMDRTTLTRNLNILQKKALISVQEGEDKRERRVALTEAGKEEVEKWMPLWEKVQYEFEDILGADIWGGLLTGLHETARRL